MNEWNKNVTRWRRSTHLPDGRPKTIRKDQQAVWEKHHPVGCLVSPDRFISFDELLDLCDGYFATLGVSSPIGEGNLEAALEELVKARLVEERALLYWPV